MYDMRLRLSNQVVEEVKMHFQQLVFDTIIQRNTKLSEAPSFRNPGNYPRCRIERKYQLPEPCERAATEKWHDQNEYHIRAAVVELG
jgi:cellulose biosynthesis protein BcsQ